MQTIGEKLEEARKRRGISLREASEVTKIRSEYLGNFETNSFDLNLPEVYIRGFLRSYAQFLKLNGDKIITDYNAHKLGESKIARTESREFLGRMDIAEEAVSAEKRAEPAAPVRHAPAPASATESGLEYNNFDKSSLIKGGAYAAAATFVVGVVVLLLFTVLRSGPEDTTLADSPGVASNPGHVLTLIARGGDIANITATERGTGMELFRGPLPDGTRQRVPFDERIRLRYTNAEFLRLEFNGNEFGFGDQRGMGTSTFAPPAQ